MSSRHRFLVRIPLDLWERLQEESQARGVSVNELIIAACYSMVSGEPTETDPAKEAVQEAPDVKDAVEQEVEFLRDIGQAENAYRVCLGEWERIRPYVAPEEKRQREARVQSLMYMGLDPVVFLQAIRRMAPSTSRVEAIIDEARRLAGQG